jgi:hypothetical protein
MTTWAEVGGIAGSWSAAALVVGLTVHIARLPNAKAAHEPTAQEQLDNDAETAREKAEFALRAADDEFLMTTRPAPKTESACPERSRSPCGANTNRHKPRQMIPIGARLTHQHTTGQSYERPVHHRD